MPNVYDELNSCLSQFKNKPLLIPAKIVAIGSSLCLKKAYFSLMADATPFSHVPYNLPDEEGVSAQKLHDLLAYLVPSVTYRLLEESATNLAELLDSSWIELQDYIEQHSNITEKDFRKHKEHLEKILSGYWIVLNWFQKHKGLTSSDTYVYTERMLISKPRVTTISGIEEFLPVIGIPDVILVNQRQKYAVVIDWKITTQRYISNELHYIQLAIYQYILSKLINEVYSFLIYVTRKKGRVKVVSLSVPLQASPTVDTQYVAFNDLEKIKIVASLLYGLAFCRNTLRLAIKLKEEGKIDKKIRVFNPQHPNAKPCRYCRHRSVCLYRFAKKEELSMEQVELRKSFFKLFKVALDKKSEEYKKFIDKEKCIGFDVMSFESPTSVRLQRTFTMSVSPLSKEVMQYSLGKTTVYVFSRHDLLHGGFDNDIYVPLLFGRYEDDEVTLQHQHKGTVLEARVRMVSPSFAIRWLPLHSLYRYRIGDKLFRDIVVCPGQVPMNIELKAIAMVESALLERRGRYDVLGNILRGIVMSASDEYD